MKKEKDIKFDQKFYPQKALKEARKSVDKRIEQMQENKPAFYFFELVFFFFFLLILLGLMLIYG